MYDVQISSNDSCAKCKLSCGENTFGMMNNSKVSNKAGAVGLIILRTGSEASQKSFQKEEIIYIHHRARYSLSVRYVVRPTLNELGSHRKPDADRSGQN